MRKSKALALGAWDRTLQIAGIPYCDELHVLGFNMRYTTHDSALRSWAPITLRLRAHAQKAYNRAMSMDVRIKYIHEFLMAQLWYVTQIFTPTEATLRQINTAIQWFLWCGEIFSVPLTTLYKNKREGGWTLISVAAKCLMLFVIRMKAMRAMEGTVTANWLKERGTGR
jgi:hypothetical protein